MKYMLIMNTPRDGYDQYTAWPKKLLEANVAFMTAFTQKLHANGELVSAEALAAPTRAKLVRAGDDGLPATDGVFPESKEFLAGYWIVDVDSPRRAYEIAAEASTAPGQAVKGADGKLIDHLWIEVREIMTGPPERE
ncbi:MAG TPA: YciI family protein [Gammaproteobacteria bacterium]|nr:YciI family protein [Gammaproteobacteria bacterium]